MTTTTKPPARRFTYEQIEEATDALELLKSDYLNERGWERTSTTPGFFWMWIKEIDGKRWTGDTSMAVAMQVYLDQCEEDAEFEVKDGD